MSFKRGILQPFLGPFPGHVQLENSGDENTFVLGSISEHPPPAKICDDTISTFPDWPKSGLNEMDNFEKTVGILIDQDIDGIVVELIRTEDHGTRLLEAINNVINDKELSSTQQQLFSSFPMVSWCYIESEGFWRACGLVSSPLIPMWQRYFRSFKIEKLKVRNPVFSIIFRYTDPLGGSKMYEFFIKCLEIRSKS